MNIRLLREKKYPGACAPGYHLLSAAPARFALALACLTAALALFTPGLAPLLAARASAAALTTAARCATLLFARLSSTLG